MEGVIKIGPIGDRSLGDVWDEKGKTNICRIYVYWDDVSLRCIQFAYAEGDSYVFSKRNSEKGYKFNSITLDYPTEMITGVSGFLTKGDAIRTIIFYTNRHTHGPFGSKDQSDFAGKEHYEIKFQPEDFYGIHGNSYRRDYITAIGVYLKPSLRPSSSRFAIKSEKD